MSKLVDPRQPRFGQAITGGALLVAFVLQWPQALPVLAVILAGASLGGPRTNAYAHLYRAAKRIVGFGPPAELEEAAPPRFANTVGFVFLSVATLLRYGFGAGVAAWTLGLIVSALALLAATTGLCVGCEAYVIARRLLTKGRVSERLVVPAGGAVQGS